MVFDVNDFDEAYLGRFTWDLQRFAASLALVGWQKALPEEDVRRLIGKYVRSYLAQVDDYRHERGRRRLRAAPRQHPRPDQGGPGGRPAAAGAPTCSTTPRSSTTACGCFREEPRRTPARQGERAKVVKAFEQYLETIPDDKRFDRDLFYELRDVVGQVRLRDRQRRPPGVQPAGRGLQPGAGQRRGALDEAGQRPGREPVRRHSEDVDRYFDHEGHRTVVSQRALQVHTDPLLGHTQLDGVGYVVSEISPYEVDLDWSGPHRARRHRRRRRTCSAGPPPRSTAPPTRTASRTSSTSRSRRRSRRAWTGAARSSRAGSTDFGMSYADQVRDDHALFVHAFREGRIGVSAT